MEQNNNILDDFHLKNKLIRPGTTGITVLFLLCITFYLADIFPFGNNTIAWGDMRQQVVPLMLQFKEILTGNQSMYFHTGSAGGTNFWGIFFFFVSSPFSIIFLVSDKINPYHLINLMAIGKIVTAGITVNIMFDRMFPKMDFFYCYILSISYSFCGFSLMFYQNVIWLDMLYLFPLLVFGMYRMYYQNKALLYTAILCSMLIVNYYMSYMIVLFIIFFYMIFFVSDLRKLKGKQTNKFSINNGSNFDKISLLAFSTLFSASVTSFVWFPSFLQYRDSSRDINILDSLRRGEFFTHYETTFSSLFPSSILLVVIPLIILNYKKIKIPIKWLILFILTLIPLFIEPINKMWHTGSYQAFPARYSYITVLTGLIILAYYFSQYEYFEKIETDSNNKNQKLKSLISPIIILFSGLLLIIYVNSFKSDKLASYVRTLWTNTETFNVLLPVFLFLGLLYTFLVILMNNKKVPYSVLKFVLVTLILTEILFNAGIYFGIPANSPDKYSNALDLRKKIEVENLSRVKIKEKYFDVNLTGGLGYPSLGTYTSLTSAKYLTVMKKLGFSSYWMEVSSSQGTVFSDILMSNRYTIIKKESLNHLPEQNIIYSNDEYFVIENLNSFYPAIPISLETLMNITDIPDGTRFDIQNHLFKSLTGSTDDLLIRYEPHESSHKNIHYKIDIKDKQTLYFDYFNEVTNRLVEPINDTFKIYVNGKLISDSYPNKRVNGILELGEFENQTVIIDIEILKPVKVETYSVNGLDNELMDKEIIKLNNINYIEEISQNKNKLQILFNDRYELYGNQFPYLLVTIPYAGDIKAFSEGNELDVKEIFGGFTAIKIPENAELIEIIYLPKAMNLSLVISLFSLTVGLIVFVFRKNLVKLKLLSPVSKILDIVFLIFSGLIFLSIYVFPVIYFLSR